MAEAHRICSIEGCDKPVVVFRGWCSKHYARWKRYGNPEEFRGDPKRDYSKCGRAKKFHVDPDWLRAEYHEKRRPTGEIAAEIGCTQTHLNLLVSQFGIPRRDGRAGRILPTRRSPVNIEQAAWMYEIERKSCAEIGEIMGCDGGVVGRRLVEHGIRIRHHNDTKRHAPARNRIRLNARKVIKAYAEPFASMLSVSEVFGVSSAVIGRILDEHKVERKSLDQCRNYKGENHPHWNPEISAEERVHRRDQQPEWRLKVFRRDGFCCVACGDSRGGNLHAHHVVAFHENKELRWELSNGVTLCETCHIDFHRSYGHQGIGQAQLNEFIAGREAFSLAS